MEKKIRQVIKTVRGQRTTDGAGVSLVRVLGNDTMYDFDPILMLDSFDSTDPRDFKAGFPTHPHRGIDRKSTRLNSSHANISYAVFCLKKKKNQNRIKGMYA